VTGEASSKPVLGIVGGTGVLGTGLARRWTRAGYSVIIGSRDSASARDAAELISLASNEGKVEGASNVDAAAAADIVVVAVPFNHRAEVIDSIRPAMRGQIVLDTTVPLIPHSPALVHLPQLGSAAVMAQRHLGSAARVLSAFHNIPAKRLAKDEPIDCDVLVFGDSAADRESIITLVEAAGLRGLHGGPLVNSVAAEALTSVLIGIQRDYHTRVAGIRITGID
jgi:8-hydroxy-5-deazaflavin:NADPH oxidoreductase